MLYFKQTRAFALQNQNQNQSMLAIVLKELRSYTRSRKYLRLHFLTLGALTLSLFVATVEFYAQSRTGAAVDVGKQTYTVFIVALFLTQFFVPRHAVEALHSEAMNGALLRLTPLSHWHILAGKLSAVVFWELWRIWLTVPLLALSSYIGGFAIAQLLKCGVVLLVSCLLFAQTGISFACWHPPIRAKSIGYGIVLIITFLPLMPMPNVPAMLEAMSPLCALLSILRSEPTQLWVWHVALSCVLSVLLFCVCAMRHPQ